MGCQVKSKGAMGLPGTLQEASRRGQVTLAQAEHACIVVQASGEALIPGPFDAGDGLSRYCLGLVGPHPVDAHQKEDQAGT